MAMAPLLLLACLSACVHTGDFDSIKGSGTIKSVTRHVADFTKVSLEGAAEVIISQGSTPSVRIEGDDNLLEHITTTVDGSELEISNQHSISPTKSIKVFVTTKQLEGLSIAGSGTITTEVPFEARAFNVSIAGSGDIIADISAEQVSASISGSGDISLRGTAKSASVSIAGSGDYKGYALTTNSTSVDIAGSGDAEVHAAETLTGNIMGSGDILYRGEPRINSSIMGSGSIEKQ
jgi:hypothetical protein